MTPCLTPDWLTEDWLKPIIGAFDAADIRFVGGAVRDGLLGRAVQDIDAATRLTPQQVTQRLTKRGLRVIPTGIKHGTVTVTSAGRALEITTLRRDVKTDGRHARVEFTSDWAADAARRDFTMNALYLAPDGRLFDPLGQGLTDAKAGRVRFIGDANARVREDYLRILRFFRFLAGYGMGRPADTAALDACRRAAPHISQLPAERIIQELRKLLGAESPLSAVTAAHDAGIWPALRLAADPPSLRRYLSLEAAPADWRMRALALFGASFARHPVALLVKQDHRFLQDVAGLVSSVASLPARVYRHGATVVEASLLLRQAWGSPQAGGWPPRAEGGAVSGADGELGMLRSLPDPTLPITARDLLDGGAEPGPHIGQALSRAGEEWVKSRFTLSRADLLASTLHRLLSAR